MLLPNLAFRSLGLAAASVIVLANATTHRTQLAKVDSEPSKAIGKATLLGLASSTKLIHLNIGLNPSRPEEFAAFANAVSDPKSPNYRHFLTPSEVGERFGPSESALDGVISYLEGKGMSVKVVAKNRLNLIVDGTVEQAQNAFHTTIGNFLSRDPRDVKKPMFFANTSPIYVPDELAPAISCVAGLENHTRPHPGLKAAKQSSQEPMTPRQVSVLYDYQPLQAQSYYGQNRTVAISSFDGFDLTNLYYLINQYNLPYPSAGVGSNVTVETLNGGSQTGPASGEADLDIQMVLEQSPYCNLTIYDGSDDITGYLDVLSQETSDNTSDIVTESYTWDLTSNSYFQSAHNSHLSMTAQGMSYFAIAGDGGANNQTANYPQCEPEVTVVGGTVPTYASNGARTSETAWIYGGGGWLTTTTPTFNTLPSWQKGTGVPTNLNYRLFPDAALLAGGTNNPSDNGAIGFYSGGNGVFYTYDGTSIGAPLFAAGLSLVEQDLIANNGLSITNGHQRLGRLNDYFYGLNGSLGVFYDITMGSNGTLPNGSASNAVTGWDTATGWGAPDFNNLAYSYLPLTVKTVSASPSAFQSGTPSTGTVTLTKPAPTGGLTVSLASQRYYYVIVPSSITVPAGSLTATFPITTVGYPKNFTDTITATYGSTSVTTTLSLTGDSVTGLTLNPASVVGGGSSTGTVTLANAAPTGGWVVNLTSQSANYVQVPATLTIPAGQSSGTFAITTKPYSQSFTCLIQAADSISKMRATLTVTQEAVTGVSVNPTSVVGGSGSTGTVTLLNPAPTGGYVVTLASQSPSYVGVPATVTVAAGATTATFAITTKPYTQTYTCIVKASDSLSKQTATLTVLGDSISSLSLSPTTVVGGNTSTATVTLNSPAPAGGWVVNLSTQRPSYVGVPTSITVPAGQTTATFTITTVAYTSAYSSWVLAEDSISHEETTLTVNP